MIGIVLGVMLRCLIHTHPDLVLRLLLIAVLLHALVVLHLKAILRHLLHLAAFDLVGLLILQFKVLLDELVLDLLLVGSARALVLLLPVLVHVLIVHRVLGDVG